MYSNINNSDESIIYLLHQLDGQNVPIKQNVPIAPRIVRRRIDSKIDKQTICSDIIDTLKKIKDYESSITTKRRKIYASALEIENLCSNYRKMTKPLRMLGTGIREDILNKQNIINNIASKIVNESQKEAPQYEIPYVVLEKMKIYDIKKLNNIRESLNQILFNLVKHNTNLFYKLESYKDAIKQIRLINTQIQNNVAMLKQKKQQRKIDKINSETSKRQHKKTHYISLIPTSKQQNGQKKPDKPLKKPSNPLFKAKPLTTRNAKVKKQILSSVPKKTADVYKKQPRYLNFYS